MRLLCIDIYLIFKILKKLFKIILGNIIDIQSKFNIKVYKQRNFFGIKIKNLIILIVFLIKL